ncbi:WbqC family protein [Cobetia sp. L2A1]|jgi:hypothetical protein|uniref:WbqC family protein n=1 Tax=Cobetia sp. L2A1 TaxID=2686360 RepID=UPI00131E1F8D|nr:WbqC family protein [Cobetia sp. L2A1]
MNIVIMQPYLLPHLGYFQLMHACDEFLIFDDVSYIPRGFINRNSVLLNGKAHRFTLSVPQASPNRLISELSFASTQEPLLETLRHAYAKAPYFAQVMPLLQTILRYEERRIAPFCQHSFEQICRYLGIRCRFYKTSEIDHDRRLKGQARLIDLASRRGASRYINSIGGRKLYSATAFNDADMALAFLSSHPCVHAQSSPTSRTHAPFVPGLSIVDVLMWCSPQDIAAQLEEYALVAGAVAQDSLPHDAFTHDSLGSADLAKKVFFAGESTNAQEGAVTCR